LKSASDWQRAFIAEGLEIQPVFFVYGVCEIGRVVFADLAIRIRLMCSLTMQVRRHVGATLRKNRLKFFFELFEPPDAVIADHRHHQLVELDPPMDVQSGRRRFHHRPDKLLERYGLCGKSSPGWPRRRLNDLTCNTFSSGEKFRWRMCAPLSEASLGLSSSRRRNVNLIEEHPAFAVSMWM